jgi:rhodanese-related sulfurtransferase
MANPFSPSELEVSPDRAAELLREGAQVIDVREDYEYDAGRIAGVRHIELERLASQAPTIDADRPVVLYCRLGVRSAMAAHAFRAAGYDAWSMAGGLEAWHAQGLPLEPDDGYVAEH